MNLTNIKNGLGFVDRDILFNRMCHFTPPEDEVWYFYRLGGRDFSELGITFRYDISDAAKKFRPESEWTQVKYYKVFQIYTGDRNLYLYICELMKNIATQLEKGFKAVEWSEDDNK